MKKGNVMLVLFVAFAASVVSAQVPNRELLDMVKSEDIAKLDKYIKDKPQEINKEISSYGFPIFYAIDLRKYNVACAMLTAGASATVKDDAGENFFHRIAKKAGEIKKDEIEKLVKLVSILKEKSCDPNLYSKNGYTPLSLLVLNSPNLNRIENTKRLAEEFINVGADPKLETKNEKKEPLVIEVISGLRKQTPLKDGSIPIQGHGSFEMIKFLAEKGYNVNVQDGAKNNPLIVLLKKELPEDKKMDMIKYLLSKKVDPKQKNKKKESSLDLVDKKSDLYQLFKKGVK